MAVRGLIAAGAAAAAWALSGCASMDQAECRTADWRAIGYEDGSQGRPESYLGERRKACADHGVTPDFESYMDGRHAGIAGFCRPQNGYRLGERGHRYSGVCPSELEPAFLAAHADGFGLYQRRAAIERLRKQLRRTASRSNEIERLIAEKTALLVSPTASVQNRVALGVEIKQLADEKVDVAKAIDRLEHDYALAESDYLAYQRGLAGRGGG